MLVMQLSEKLTGVIYFKPNFFILNLIFLINVKYFQLFIRLEIYTITKHYCVKIIGFFFFNFLTIISHSFS